MMLKEFDVQGIKCIFWKGDKCNSDYNNGEKCDGINPPHTCPYFHYKNFIKKLKD